MKRYLVSLCIVAVFSVSGLVATALQASPATAKDNKSTASSHSNEPPPNPGEQVFLANCGRCHQPPMTIPQRVTGTVIMHMRVRARLSRKDEQLLLKYLAP